MYRITVVAEGETYTLFASGSDILSLDSPVLTLEMGAAGSLLFGISAEHPYYSKIHVLSSEFYVYQDGEELFRGRYIGREEDFLRTGKVTCEGDLAYLLDSQQRPYEHHGSIEQFLEARLTGHNHQVEANKRYDLGKVTVADTNNEISHVHSGYSDTLTCLRSELVKTHGGYLRTRYENGRRFLDYVTDYGGSNRQIIRFGGNLLDLTQYIDAAKIVTALIPLGAEVEYISDTDGTKCTKIVDITSVNNGKDYIYHEEAVAKYGWIFGVQKWEDVTVPENLLAKARAYLQDCVSLPASMELTAVDLSLAAADIQQLRVGCWTTVQSQPHGLCGTYLLTKRTYHLTAPEKDIITLGNKSASLTGTGVKNKQDISWKVRQTAEYAGREINRKVENATNLITGGLGGYIVIGLNEVDRHPEELLIMDAPVKEQAKNVIRLNQHGLGFSTSGYGGVYRNAWTIDGSLVADFVTTGSMLADRIRGGTLEVGGAGLGRDGEVVLKSAGGDILCIMNNQGIDLRKGTIIGTDMILGGDGNVAGSLYVRDEEGGIVCSLSGDGLYAIAGEIGGWRISSDCLETDRSIIRSTENGNAGNRATMTDAAFKVWVNDSECCYMGRGGYHGRGDPDSGLIFTGGRSGIELDGSSGRVNAQGDVAAGGNVTANGRMECNGNLNCRGNSYFTGGRNEFSGDIYCSGGVWGNNLVYTGELDSLRSSISNLNKAIENLNQRLTGLGG